LLADFPQDFHLEILGLWKAWLGVEMDSHISRLRGMNVLRASLAQDSDAQALLHEYYEAVDVVKRDSDEEIRAYLSDREAGLWIAYVEEEPVGCVVLRPLPSVALSGECKRLYVRPSFRGQGIADALLDAMEGYAREMGWAWVYLDSKDDLREALRIYVRRGYVECDRYNDNPQATVFLRKELKGSSET
jgi:GNAT superfamily N-acetyltransferase